MIAAALMELLRDLGRVGPMIAHRLASGLLTLLLVSFVVFVGTELLSGDVAQAVLGQAATAEALAAMRERLGLNEPSYIRYFYWLKGLMTGDLGLSLATARDVSELIGQRLGNTLLLAAATAVIAIPAAIFLGLAAAVRPGGFTDRTISYSTLCVISVPEFFIAAVLVFLIAVQLRWLPALSVVREGDGLAQTARALALPVATLTLSVLAHMVRMTRAAVLSVLSSGYIETAVLKGASKLRVILLHALPNVLSPIVNVVAINLAYLVSGIAVVETVFAFPGLGRLMVDAVLTRDTPLIQGCAMIFCALYVGINLVADLVSVLTNPRLRYSK